MTTRRALLAAGLAMPVAAAAQPAFPSRPLRLLAPYTPGGGVDTTARLIAGPAGQFLGQSIVVENRPGAGGSLGAAELARSPADGHTIMVDALAHVVNPHLLRGLPFDYATAFTPISELVVLPQLLLVPNSLPVRTLAEFIAYAKARPGQLSVGNSGNATAAHLAAALLLQRADIRLEHIPYRGGTAALQDLLAGNIAAVFGTVSSSLQLVRDGQARALGVTTLARITPLPDLPTIAEQGFPGYELNEWNGFYTVAGVPAPVVAKLYEAAKHALADATVKQRLEALGAIPVGSDPAAFAATVAARRAAMGQLVRDARIEIG